MTGGGGGGGPATDRRCRSDNIEFPWEDLLHYEDFTVKISEEKALRPGYVEGKLRGMDRAAIDRKLANLQKVKKFFLYEEGVALEALLSQF